jgi:hypothetical protein
VWRIADFCRKSVIRHTQAIASGSKPQLNPHGSSFEKAQVLFSSPGSAASGSDRSVYHFQRINYFRSRSNSGSGGIFGTDRSTDIAILAVR